MRRCKRWTALFLTVLVAWTALLQSSALPVWGAEVPEESPVTEAVTETEESKKPEEAPASDPAPDEEPAQAETAPADPVIEETDQTQDPSEEAAPAEVLPAEEPAEEAAPAEMADPSNENVQEVTAEETAGEEGLFEEVLTEEEEEEVLDVYDYSVKDFGASGSDTKDDKAAIQSALNKGRSATASKKVTVNIPAGTYYISGPLGIYSNTNLVLASGARIVRTDPSSVMLCNAKASTGGYGQLTGVTVTGGTWDGNLSDASGNLKASCRDASTGNCKYIANLLYFWHGSGITVSNTVLEDCCGNHHLELAGVKDSTISNVSFRKFYRYSKTKYTATDKNPVGTGSASSTAPEALQLDSCVQSHCAGAKPSDGTACKNITVTGCSFQDVMTGVGCHNSEHTTQNIQVKNCSFKSIYYACVQFKNFKSSAVTGCTASDVRLFLDAWNSTGITVSGSTISYGNSQGLLDAHMFVLGSVDAEIRNNTIRGNGLSILTMAGDSSDVTFSGNSVTLTRAAKTTPIFSAGGRLTLTGNTITSPKGGVGGKNTVYIQAGTLTASSNTIRYAESAAFRMVGTTTATLKNNQIQSPAGKGYFFTGSKLTASGNTVNNSGSPGIHIGGGTVSLSGEKVYNASGNALLISVDGNASAGAMTISGCDLTGTTGALVINNAKASVTVRDCTIHTGTKYPAVNVMAVKSGKVTGCFMTGGNWKKAKAGAGMNISGNVRCGASLSQYSVFYFNAASGKYLGCQAVTYGKSTALKSASSLKASKSGYTFTGWYAHRVEDDTWYAVKNGKAAWVRLTGGKLPAGYSYYLYKNTAKVARTAGTGKTVRMCAQWKKKGTAK